jgi:hypothetical protein
MSALVEHNVFDPILTLTAPEGIGCLPQVFAKWPVRLGCINKWCKHFDVDSILDSTLT